MGSNDINVAINELDNDITGNDGNNRIIFSGNRADYQIETSGESTIITDNTIDRDGKTMVRKVEQLQFMDEMVNL